MGATACRCMVSWTCKYRSWVIATEAGLTSSETILGLMPCPSSSVAAVCRRSWNRIRGTPARFIRGMKLRLARLLPRNGPPHASGKTRASVSSSFHVSPAASRSSSCLALAATAVGPAGLAVVRLAASSPGACQTGAYQATAPESTSAAVVLAPSSPRVSNSGYELTRQPNVPELMLSSRLSVHTVKRLPTRG
jgi:hypothetical protein